MTMGPGRPSVPDGGLPGGPEARLLREAVMTWVRRVEAVPRHECEQPERDLMIRVPSTSLTPPSPDLPEPVAQKFGTVPDGDCGDLWRCDECGRLWRIAKDEWSVAGAQWRSASCWQRFRHRDSR